MKVMSVACTVAGASVLMGCSLLYNPNNLPPLPIDAAAPPDAPTVVQRDLLRVDVVGPKKLLEGQGTGGSRPAILAITGINIAPDAVVALVAVDAQTPAPLFEVDNEHAVRSPSGVAMAVPVTLPIDTGRAGTPDMCKVALTVQVTQMGATGPIMKTINDPVFLCNLPELDAAPSAGAPLAPLYSRVMVPAGLSFPGIAGPALVRAVASIELGDVHADGIGQNPGPGGIAGGATLAAGGGQGGGQAGLTLVAGKGAGFAQRGGPTASGGAIYGDELILSYAANTSSGGGGGGGGTAPGGGGGGTLELSAGGTLKAGKISANGGIGGPGTAVLFGAGGGGSGGTIVLRAGAAAMVGAISTDGGPGGSAGPVGGAGGGGRLRYDVPSFSMMPTMPAASRRGVAFEASTDTNPLVTTESPHGLSVISVVSATTSTNVFDAFVFDASNTNTAMMTFTFVTTQLAFSPPLNKGYNHVCVTPHGHNPLVEVAVTNCLDIAYVP